MKNSNSRLVYSTDRNVQRKKKPDTKSPVSMTKPADQRVIVRVERKGRGGKTVTVIDGLHTDQNTTLAFLRQLKAKLGTGGTIRQGCFEFQGDHADRLLSELKKMGYNPKRSGG